MAAIWLTPAGNLGVIPALEFYQFALDAYNVDGGDLTYSIISGSLPLGLHLDANGNVQGVPINELIEGVPAAVNKVTTSTFVVRITTQSGQVTDRTFTLSVAGIAPPEIITTSADLGDHYDGDRLYAQLYAVELNPGLTVSWELISGELPPGLTLTSTGIIDGYIEPAHPAGGEPGWESQSWEDSLWDFQGVDINRNYKFTVTAYDGVNYDSTTYNIYVYARATMTADTDTITDDNSSIVTADDDTIHLPVILTLNTTLPAVRQNEKHAFQIEATDFDGDAIEWLIIDGESELNAVGLYMNSETGWITGLVNSGSLANRNLEFTVQVRKRDNPTYVSVPFIYTLEILGQVDSQVTWLTDSNLGIVDNGAICDLSVSATTPSGRTLFYRIPSGSDSQLPQGLKLLPDGIISGRVAFETFKIDNSTTTYDGGYTTFDKVYSFVIEVYDSDGYISDTKTFRITINEANKTPYNNLYIQALPSKDQRDLYSSIINDTDIFPIEDIYKITDPWFGKNSTMRSLFLTGINPDTLANYISAMEKNHYGKKINFGNLKTAKALDSNFNTKYEVVYLELNDNQTNENNQSVSSNIALTSNTRDISTIYPNSFTNMVQQFTDNIGYANKSILPVWMTSRQDDGRVLGFTRALVLCYTKPGKSKEILYRLQAKLQSFQLIDFTIDRYELDSVMSDYYNLETNSFVNSYNASGTISCNSSSTVTGTDTVFTEELAVGQTISVNGVAIGRIMEIVSDTELYLFQAYSEIIEDQLFSHTIGETTFDRSSTATTFDHEKTRFFGDRVTYTTPSQGDKYLKFPQIGVLE